MAQANLRIWCNVHFPEDVQRWLVEAAAPHRLLFSASLLSSNLVAGPADPQLDSSDAAFGQPTPEQVVGSATALRWIHLSSAGYERYDRADFRETLGRRGAALTTSSGVYSEPCAQHALAMVLAMARRLPEAWENQRTDRGWPVTSIRRASFLLNGQTALLLGYGSIGRRLAELLIALELKVVAVRRRPRGDEGVPTFSVDQADRLLGEADHVISILPGGSETQSFMSAARFAQMRPTAIFYNIGRGSTVDQEALVEALRSGRLAGACLDVMTPEPLPPDHALWHLSNCLITPHTAGGHAGEMRRLAEHFIANLRRWDRGETLLDRVM